MRTKKSVDGILARIYETGGLNPDMEADIKALQSELDEREGILNRYGEAYDGEDEEYEWKPNNRWAEISAENPSTSVETAGEAEPVDTPDGTVIQTQEIDYKEKYDELKARYIAAFMTGGIQPDEPEQEAKKDLQEDTDFDLSIDQMWARADKMYRDGMNRQKGV